MGIEFSTNQKAEIEKCKTYMKEDYEKQKKLIIATCNKKIAEIKLSYEKELKNQKEINEANTKKINEIINQKNENDNRNINEINKLRKDLGNQMQTNKILSVRKQNVEDVNKYQQNLINEYLAKINELEENKKEINKEYAIKQNEMKKIIIEFDKRLKEEKIINQKKCEEINEIKRNSQNKINELIQEKNEQIRIKLLKEKEKNIKKRDLEDRFIIEYDNIKSEQIQLILEDFREKKSGNFCKEDIKKLLSKKSSIKKLIIESFGAEKINLAINYHLKSFIKDYENYQKDIEHLNIIIVGPTGVGKTTLINALLNLNLKTGFGTSTTREISYYESGEIPFLRLADSRGIEKDKNFNVDKAFESIKNFIDYQIKNKNPDKFVHCIWYCWKGTRLEEVEIELLNKLSHQYSLKQIPVIFVYTNSIRPYEVIEAKNYIKSLKMDNELVDILAKDDIVGGRDESEKTIKSFGLDKLTELSIQQAKSAIDSSCYQEILFEVRKKFEGILDIIKLKSKEKIDKVIEDFVYEMSINFELYNIIEKVKEITVNIFYCYCYLSPNIQVDNDNNNFKGKINDILHCEISQKTLLNIQEFLNEHFNIFIQIYYNNLQNLINKYSKDIIEKIDKFRLQFILENGNKFDMISSTNIENDIKESVRLTISNEAKISAFKNFFISITTLIIEEFSSYFKTYYKSEMSGKKFIEKIKNNIKISFDKIEEKIKKYNDEKNSKKECKNEEKRIRNSSRIDEEEEEREKEINNFRANITKNEDYDYD